MNRRKSQSVLHRVAARAPPMDAKLFLTLQAKRFPQTPEKLFSLDIPKGAE